MDGAMLSHLQSMNSGGEGGGHGRILGFLPDSQGLSQQFTFEGLEGLLKKILSAFHDGRNPFNLGSENGLGAKFMKWLKKIAQSIGEGCSQGASECLEKIRSMPDISHPSSGLGSPAPGLGMEIG